MWNWHVRTQSAGADPRKLVQSLQSKYNTYLALSGHAEFTGIRVTPSVYTTVQEVDFFARMVERNSPRRLIY